MDDEDEPMDVDDEEDDEYGVKRKAKPKVKKLPKLAAPVVNRRPPCERLPPMGCFIRSDAVASVAAAFPARRAKSLSSDEDYAVKAHKKKAYVAPTGRSTPDTFDSDWRRGAAKKVVNYNEAEVDYGLGSEPEIEATGSAGPGGSGMYSDKPGRRPS